MHSMVQGRRGVIEYLAEFDRTMLEANALKDPDSSKILNARRGLNQSIKNILVSTKDPTTYREHQSAPHRIYIGGASC